MLLSLCLFFSSPALAGDKEIGIKEILKHIKPSSFVQLQYSGNSTNENNFCPNDGNEVFKVFKGKSSIQSMHGKTGKLSKSTFVRIIAPEKIGHIVRVMAELANRESDGMGYEYAYSMYISEKEGMHFLVQKGKNWFAPSINPGKFLISPEGERLILFATLAHTHPFGAPDPSSADRVALKQTTVFSDSVLSFKQKFGLLVVPGGGWSLFDSGNKTILGNNQIANLQMTELFSN